MRQFVRRNRSSMLAALVGMGIFAAIYGVRILNPLYIDWLYSGGDLSQHYLGWKGFREAAWTFPIGLTDRLIYPFSSSVIFTDSIPLLAVFFKLLSPLLPADFQYFGLWGIVCYGLNGAVSAKILRKYLKSDLQAVTGSVFFILSFQVVFRMYVHTSLAAHWIILLAILFCVYRDSVFASVKSRVLMCVLLGIVCSGVHMYFLLMCGIILLGFALLDFLENRDVRRPALILLVYIAAAAGNIFILGGFSAGGMDSGGLGEYSFNLNGFFNSMGYGRFLPELFHTSGQVEGFAYVGAGILLMLLIACLNLLVYKIRSGGRGKRLFSRYTLICFGLVNLAAVIVAASPGVNFGNVTLWEWPVPDWLRDIWSVFRASGRIAWIGVYCLMLFALCADARIIAKGWKTGILMLCLAIQLMDIFPFVQSVRQRFSETAVYQSPLQDQTWQLIGEDEKIQHVILIPGLPWEEQYHLAVWALDYGMTLNDFHMGHEAGEEQAFAQLEQDLAEPREDRVYIWRSDNTAECLNYDLYYYACDQYIVGLAEPLEGVEPLAEDDSRLGSFSYSFAGQYLLNGADENGIRTLNPGGSSFGPYLNMAAGRYQVTIEGEHLDGGTFSIAYSNGDLLIPLVEYEQTENRVTFSFELDKRISDVEVVIVNEQEDILILNRIQIEPAY